MERITISWTRIEDDDKPRIVAGWIFPSMVEASRFFEALQKEGRKRRHLTSVREFSEERKDHED